MNRRGLQPPGSSFTGDQFRFLSDWFKVFYGESTVPYLRRVTADSTLSVDDDLLLVQSASTATITLLPASNLTFRIFAIKQQGAGNVIVDGHSSEVIDGSTTTQTGSQYRTITIQSTGTEWVSR